MLHSYQSARCRSAGVPKHICTSDALCVHAHRRSTHCKLSSQLHPEHLAALHGHAGCLLPGLLHTSSMTGAFLNLCCASSPSTATDSASSMILTALYFVPVISTLCVTAILCRGGVGGGGPGGVQDLLPQAAQHHVGPLGHKHDVSLLPCHHCLPKPANQHHQLASDELSATSPVMIWRSHRTTLLCCADLL